MGRGGSSERQQLATVTSDLGVSAIEAALAMIDDTAAEFESAAAPPVGGADRRLEPYRLAAGALRETAVAARARADENEDDQMLKLYARICALALRTSEPFPVGSGRPDPARQRVHARINDIKRALEVAAGLTA